MGVYAGPAEYWYNSDEGRISQSTNIVVQDGLVLNLDAGASTSYPGSGTSWTDLSGNGNNGTLVNGVGYDSANGGSLSFDGTNDYVEVARSDDFDFGTGDLTIESWVYLDTYNTVEGNMLVYKTQSSLSAGSACGNYVNGNGLLSMSASDNTSYQVNVSGGTVTLNRWHHVCITRVGSTWTCYLNTTQVSTATWAGSVSHVTTGSFGGIGIGAYTSAYGGNTGKYSMDGKISGVKIYKGKGLTASEIQQNYNALKGRYV